ncbi:Phospholipid phosphatase 6 [Echinococcus granulosus]|uniref:Phosphatidic acid phosphatase type 2 n=1 Tax=Echinococcus granulosus TaxID=6210 RepID=A0A068WNW2_ECHGR|nr:Phospholipid phosphatase 6 [Echinococcus granulosus]CDS19361.1 phosphatidic acid phosphatase type 2 [Echinococcus granulosus]
MVLLDYFIVVELEILCFANILPLSVAIELLFLKVLLSFHARCELTGAMLPSPRCLGLALEWSCHGVPWFIFSGGWILGLLISSMAPPPSASPASDPYVAPRSTRNLYGWRAACLLFALVLDVLVVGCLKFIVKRPRPEANYSSDMLLTVSIDDWSFPSGHSSRAGMLQWLLPWLFNFSGFSRLLISVWTVSVCISRLVMRRHHLGDILFGYTLGFCLYYLVTWSWLHYSPLLLSCAFNVTTASAATSSVLPHMRSPSSLCLMHCVGTPTPPFTTRLVRNPSTCMSH